MSCQQAKSEDRSGDRTQTHFQHFSHDRHGSTMRAPMAA
jgi:hypothetical protein